MTWTEAEVEQLRAVLDRIVGHLRAQDPHDVLVVCSAGGDVASLLAAALPRCRIVGIELDDDLRRLASRRVVHEGLGGRVEFLPAEMTRIPFPDGSFDAVVGEFVVYPTPMPTQFGQDEMARVLRPGGRVELTDVIVTRRIRLKDREALEDVGLDYLCEATAADFRRWMDEAGLVDVGVDDITELIGPLWEDRAHSGGRRRGHALLLDDQDLGLGRGIFYIAVRGTKPPLDTSSPS